MTRTWRRTRRVGRRSIERVRRCALPRLYTRFIPRPFRKAGQELQLIDYEVAAFVPTQPNTFEFHVSLRLLDSTLGRQALQDAQAASIHVARGRADAASHRQIAPSGLVRMEVSGPEEKTHSPEAANPRSSAGDAQTQRIGR